MLSLQDSRTTSAVSTVREILMERGAELRSKQKNSAAVSALLRQQRESISSSPSLTSLFSSQTKDPARRRQEQFQEAMSHIKNALIGDEKGEPVRDLTALVAQECYKVNLPGLIIQNISSLDFQSKKDCVLVFNALLRRQIGGTRWPTVDFLTARPDIVLDAVRGYSDADAALDMGAILREMIKYQSLATIIIYSEELYALIDAMENMPFGIACDAQTSFRDLLLRHKSVSAEFLDTNYTRFFRIYNPLMLSSNYVSKRQSLKLLADILLDRAFFQIMVRYVSDAENLKAIMNLLRSQSKSIQFEAFNIFKLFVANPKKSPPVLAILRRNKDKLCSFLDSFHNDKRDDTFTDEKLYLIDLIRDL